jgi:hypothetical protein
LLCEEVVEGHAALDEDGQATVPPRAQVFAGAKGRRASAQESGEVGEHAAVGVDPVDRV